MGFRTGAFAKVWTVESISETNTKLRISISRKNRRTQEYEQDFSGFVNCIGTAAASKACSLKEGSRIKLGDVDVTTNYNKEKGTSYTNFKICSTSSFEVFYDMGETTLSEIGRQLNSFLRQCTFHCPNDYIFMESITEEEYDALTSFLEDYRRGATKDAD